ncbi:MAG: hypothetical protein NZ957_01255 [Thaumarchaeota archaeon]|nr:hypothetical protein [Candidatus Calditenuaceae archaeon]MDW8041691.1 hypothetical protein [Nitrososphaerota archaeon]
MLVETHGEVCRLGYLRVVAAVVASLDASASLEYVAAVLHNIAKNAPFSSSAEAKSTGVIRNPITARNYVTLAKELGFVGSRAGVLGPVGNLFISMRSSAKFVALVKGDTKLAHRDLIALNPFERFFMLYVIYTKDHLALKRLIQFVTEREEFSRNDCMNYLMEEVYPEALRLAASSVGKRKRAEYVQKLEEAMRFREIRLGFSKKSEWIRSSLYAKYRHIAPPRIEWLVDLGLIEKVGRGRYATTAFLKSNAEAFKKVMEFPPSSGVDVLFSSVAPIYMKYVKSPAKQVVLQELSRSFKSLSGGGREPVEMRSLEVAAALALLENNYLMTPKELHNFINGLTLIYSDKVYVMPGEDGLYVTKFAIADPEQ